jgi:hypothetical protein
LDYAYGYAIHILELTFAASAKSENPASDALLKIWIHFVSDRYLELLSERQPGSLIIYAHYAVLLQRSSEQYWYLKGVAEQILHVADSLVPTEWKAWLAWPKEQIYGVHANCVAQQYGAIQLSDYYFLLRNCLRTIVLQVVRDCAILMIGHELNKYTHTTSVCMFNFCGLPLFDKPWIQA